MKGLDKAMKASRGVIGLLLALGCATPTLAQTPDLKTPPAKIAFGPWSPISEEGPTHHYEVRFPSPVPSGIAANDTVVLDIFMPAIRSEPVPAVVILHYWGATDLRVETNLAHRLNAHGIAGVVVTLPYHLKRTPPGSRTGAMAITSDPDKLIQTMVQSVADVRRAVDWVQSRAEFDSARIGISGTSLGALVAALAVGVEPRLKHAAFMLGGVDLAHIIWHSSRVVRQRDEMRSDGLTEEKLRARLSPIEPLAYLPESQLQSSFVISAKYDTVVPPEDARKLIGSLRDPKTLWLDSGHYGGFLVEKQVQAAMAEYFDRSFGGRSFAPPERVFAPVIRFGMEANPDTQLQVVLGLDFWRWNAKGDAFATAIFTPRGPQAFLGVAASKGLAIGVSVRSGKVSPGFFWSQVL